MANSKIPAAGGMGCHHGGPAGATVITPPIYKVDYDTLTDKPSINGVTLEGDKTAEDLGLHVDVPLADDADIDSLFPSYIAM